MYKLLTQYQAEAAYSAMASLNNVGGNCNVLKLGNKTMRVDENTGNIVIIDTITKDFETYESQSHFAIAYKLDQLY